MGERVILRAVNYADYDAIRDSELSGDDSVAFRHRGSTPSPEQFVASLWGGVLSQYLVVTREDNRRVGLVTCYDPDFRNSFAYMGGFVFPQFRSSGWALEGFELFIDLLFHAFPFRKVYGEVLAPNLEQFRYGLGGVAIEEGRYRSHEYFGGEYVDKVILALYREQWSAREERPFQQSGLLAHLKQSRGSAGAAEVARAIGAEQR